ncbi:MAG: gliding motility-associated ABC transporter ATP-binding subunit GldA [Chitinophagaceae bacterium]|nr:gliding motility-associated ABC transporter ATP-binding subunit GldA [Chitinophagaceae bacterium]
MSVIINNLSKQYGTQKAVDSISFTINKGEIVGFLGPNGAGKSTTMKMITGYLQPDSGDIAVAGINSKLDPKGIKRKIGYLPEANPLYVDMYVQEYLQFIANIQQVSNSKAAIKRVIELTGLSLEQHKKITQLSKGYKQRVGLAAALVHDPEVLILDEPTSGLDPNQIIEIREVIKRLGQDKTVLFSSHILPEVEALCERVIIINKGKLVADNLLSNLQKTTSANTVKVNFREPLEEEWLKRLPSVINVEKKDNYTWVLESQQPDNLNRELMEMSLLHNLKIVTLQTENNDLEAIFRTLTVNE